MAPLFTVIGIYESAGNRFCDTYEAEDVPGAIAQAQDFAASQEDLILVAGVAAGDVSMVDSGSDPYDPF